VLLITGFWVGFANMLAFVNLSTVLMEHTPYDQLGRLLSTRQVVLAGVRVAALVGFGWLVDLTGNVRIGIGSMALLSLLGVFVAVTRFPEVWRYHLARVPRKGSMIEAAPEFRPLSGLRSRVERYLETHTTPEFAISEQRVLNLVALLILVIGWFALGVRIRMWAIGLAVTTILCLRVARTVVHRIGPWVAAGGRPPEPPA
jgi:MFS family permease